MSVVGPRPALPNEVATYNDYQRQRLLVKPGMTCYWQTRRNRDSITFDEWVDLDLWTEGIVGNYPRGATLYQFVSQGAACAERCDLPLVHHLFQYAAGRGLADLEQRLRLFSGD